MTTTGKWIELKDGMQLTDVSYEDCVIVLKGRMPPSTLADRIVLHNCTIAAPPHLPGLGEVFRTAEWRGRPGYAVHEPEVRDAIARSTGL